MRLADYVLHKLAQAGIDKCFLVYGSAIGDLVDAFTRQNSIGYVCPQHEQGGGFMAEGYSKVTGNIGCAMATSGPGGMNLVTPIGNAFYDSVPMIFLTGNVKTAYMRQNTEIRQVGFQESPIVDIVKPITKYAAMVMRAEDVRWHLEKALFLCRHRRPGPVLLDFPIDVQKAEIDPETLDGFDAVAFIRHDAPPPVQDVDAFVAAYAADLTKAERPVILIGGGCQGYADVFRRTFEPLGVPCYPTFNALDIVTSDFPWYGGRIGTYGGAGRNLGIQNCDLLLAIGSRISGRITGGAPETFARGAKKYLVDVDAALLDPANQPVRFDRMLDCDAATFMNRLAASISAGDYRHYEWAQRCLAWRQKYDPAEPHDGLSKWAPVDPYLFVRELSRQLPENAVLVHDCGGNAMTICHAFETKAGQRVFTSNGNSPMGFSLAGAIGAWFADPSRPVVCIIGDGGMQVNIQELQTIAKYGVGIKVFILNNTIYGITKAYQQKNFEGREIACGPDGYGVPSFIDIAQAYDLGAMYINSNDKMAQEIDWALKLRGPQVIDVNCDGFCAYEPFVKGWDTGIEDMHPLLDRDEFRENMIVKPLPGWKERT